MKSLYLKAWNAIDKRKKDQEKALEKLKWEYIFSDREANIDEIIHIMENNSDTNIELTDCFLKPVNPVITIDHYITRPENVQPF